MPKFKVTVTEEIEAVYKTVEIDAPTAEAALDIAEEMRVQGTLGEPNESVVDTYGSVSAA